MELKRGIIPLLIAAALWVAAVKVFIVSPGPASVRVENSDFQDSPDFVRETVEEIQKVVASNL